MPNGFELELDGLVVEIVEKIKKFSKRHGANPLIIAKNILKEVLENLE